MSRETIRGWFSAAAVMAMVMLMLGAFGCTTDSGTRNADDPTTRAMADPMQYSPPDDTDISGGGITNFDSKAFHKDMDHVVNP